MHKYIGTVSKAKLQKNPNWGETLQLCRYVR